MKTSCFLDCCKMGIMGEYQCFCCFDTVNGSLRLRKPQRQTNAAGLVSLEASAEFELKSSERHMFFMKNMLFITFSF